MSKPDRDWGDYRKLFTQLPPAFERLPFAARALAAELGRRCDRKGRVVPCDGCDACASLVDDVAFHVRAHDDDREFITAGIACLLEDGFLIFRDGWLTIRNFEEAQESESAKRMRKKRALEASSRDESDDCASHPSHPSPGMVGLVCSTPDPEGVQGEGSGPAPKPEPIAAVARRVFEAWKLDTGHHRATLDQKRQRRIEARIREGLTEQDLLDALEGRRSDPWLMGTDPKSPRVFDEIDTLFRDAAQVERLRDLRRGPAGPGAVSDGLDDLRREGVL
jgi:hypothetical protein